MFQASFFLNSTAVETNFCRPLADFYPSLFSHHLSECAPERPYNFLLLGSGLGKRRDHKRVTAVNFAFIYMQLIGVLASMNPFIEYG